jgi:hypothetical protein
MLQFFLGMIRKATCNAILGGVDDAMDQLGEIGDGSDRPANLRERVLALTAKASADDSAIVPTAGAGDVKPSGGKRGKS